MQLVDLRTMIPDAIVDLRYATTDNITGIKLYDHLIPELDHAAASALALAASVLRKNGYRLVIWDGYRTQDVQKQLRAVDIGGQYVLEDSNHCKGLAIDLTLVNREGEVLDMGTEFDTFTPKAHVGTTEITPEQASNRAILADAMLSSGFKEWPYEWWHYDYQA